MRWWCLVLPAYFPLGTGYEVAFAPALANYPSGDHVQDATRMNAVIEHGVRERPDQYMWSYKRFKTRPDNLPSFYETKK